jgi:dephospho-CoA kinase
MSSAGKGPFVIGVTGNIACGKSTVMDELSRLGAVTIDADQVYHQMIEPETELWQALVDHFGPEITGAEGHIDRRKLGRIVFGDPARLAELEQLTHPAIRSELRRMIGEHASGVIAIDAVKLLEGGIGQDCDSIWLVTCRPDQQVARLLARNGLSLEDAEKRIAAQPAVEPKLAVADVHIGNTGDIDSTLAQVQHAWEALSLDGYARQAGDTQAGAASLPLVSH